MNVYKKLRKEKLLTQTELAKILNVEQGTISKWELNKAVPDYPTLIKLAEIFNVSVDYLLGRRKEDEHKLNTQINEMQKKTPLDNSLSESEQLWLEFYRNLPPATIQMICNMLKPVLPEQTETLSKITKKI